MLDVCRPARSKVKAAGRGEAFHSNVEAVAGRGERSARRPRTAGGGEAFHSKIEAATAAARRSESVRGRGCAQREKHDDEGGKRHHAHLTSDDACDELVLLSLCETGDRLGIGQPAPLEDRLR